jgi:hypothetical protein
MLINVSPGMIDRYTYTLTNSAGKCVTVTQIISFINEILPAISQTITTILNTVENITITSPSPIDSLTIITSDPNLSITSSPGPGSNYTISASLTSGIEGTLVYQYKSISGCDSDFGSITLKIIPFVSIATAIVGNVYELSPNKENSSKMPLNVPLTIPIPINSTSASVIQHSPFLGFNPIISAPFGQNIGLANNTIEDLEWRQGIINQDYSIVWYVGLNAIDEPLTTPTPTPSSYQILSLPYTLASVGTLSQLPTFNYQFAIDQLAISSGWGGQKDYIATFYYRIVRLTNATTLIAGNYSYLAPVTITRKGIVTYTIASSIIGPLYP